MITTHVDDLCVINSMSCRLIGQKLRGASKRDDEETDSGMKIGRQSFMSFMTSNHKLFPTIIHALEVAVWYVT